MLAQGSSRLLGNELVRAGVSIMALQEVRWSGAGESKAGDYTFLWSGPPDGAPRRAGIALALDGRAFNALINWQPVNDRILIANFKHSFGHLSVVAVYAPTEEASDQHKDEFYFKLEQALRLTKANGLLLCLGDFNAVTGQDRTGCRSVVGPFGSGIPNDNSDRLIDFCVGNGLRICGSWFKRRNIHRHTWYSNDGHTKKEIDHVLVNTRWNAVQQCRVYRSMEFDTDHRAVVATIAVKLKRASMRTQPPPRLNVRMLQDPATQQRYAVEVSNRFAALAEIETNEWDTYKQEMNAAALLTLGSSLQPKKEWLTQRTLELIEEKRAARLHGNKTEHKSLMLRCKAQILADKQKWADDLATEAEDALKRGQLRDAFSNFRRLRSACTRVSSPILRADGTLATDKMNKLRRWKEYYCNLLNRPHAPPSTELQQAAATAEVDHTIDCEPPTEDEVQQAMRSLKNGKAPGVCNISAEMMKSSGPAGVAWLTSIFKAAWNTGQLPDDWRKGIILPFYKGKGSRQDCCNYRGITLLSVPGKLFAHILLSRVKERLLKQRRKEQSGFTPGRSTTDRIITLNLLLQTRREFNRPLWIAYVDLKAAFDSVDRNALWLLLRSLGLPLKIVDLMRALYTDTMSCVRADGSCSEWFDIKSGVRQGCTIAPNLFCTPMDWLLTRTTHRGFAGTSIGNETFSDLDFADDVALLSEMLEVVILALIIMEEEARPFGLEINWAKTKIQATVDTQPASSLVAQVNGNQVEIVESFTYLGSTIHSSGSSEPEIRRRISIARECMKILDRNIWRSQISLDTKLRLYKVYVIPILLYGADTWSITATTQRKLDAFDNWCLRRILKIPWSAHITNQEVRERTQIPPVSNLIRSRRLQLFGHIARAPEAQDHTRALNACLAPPRSWKRRRGRPRHTWLRTIEEDLKQFNYGLYTARRRALDRDAWRQLVTTATSTTRPG